MSKEPSNKARRPATSTLTLADKHRIESNRGYCAPHAPWRKNERQNNEHSSSRPVSPKQSTVKKVSLKYLTWFHSSKQNWGSRTYSVIAVTGMFWRWRAGRQAVARSRAVVVDGRRRRAESPHVAATSVDKHDRSGVVGSNLEGWGEKTGWARRKEGAGTGWLMAVVCHSVQAVT